MKITIVGPAHPYRGGLASILEILARTFQRRGAEVDIRTFTLQYPSLLFPGESQTVTTPPPGDLHITRCVNTVNPFNWLRVGGIYMSEQVHGELKAYTSVPALFSPHPLFENFGERVERSEACVRLGLNPEMQYVLFFGLIRDYKGLDLLLDAWGRLRREGRTQGRRLIVAGEFYTSKEPYLRQIADLGLQEEVLLHDRFVPDEEVKYYFSAADFVVQPYKTATQSGVTQIAYQFCVPMVVSDVGGLAEIVPDGRVGYVCAPTAASVASAIVRMYDGDTLARFRHNCVEERRRFSWEEMGNRITELYALVRGR